MPPASLIRAGQARRSDRRAEAAHLVEVGEIGANQRANSRAVMAAEFLLRRSFLSLRLLKRIKFCLEGESQL